MNNLYDLEELFCKFPGIGPKQAKRFVYFLLSSNDFFVEQLTNKIQALKQGVRSCQQCWHIFPQNYTDEKLCPICRDGSRETYSLLLVARDIDLEHIEKVNVYHGLYFVLGGTIPILDKEPEKRIRLRQLLSYLAQNENINEIILGLNATPEGEHTAKFVIDQLNALGKEIKISRLGRGLSTGTELEYSDKETLKNALERRV